MNSSTQATVASPSQTAPDLVAIKNRQQLAWASGDFAVVGVTLQIVGETLAEAANICAGQRVLDVAAGNGNATLAAARRFADVISTDYVPELLEKGRLRAEADGLQVRFQVADAEALPFADAAFDAVLSTFGVMFAPDHERCAQEMLRVVRPGGSIGLANWTPDGFIGQLFKVMGGFIAPPAGIKPPALWGTGAHLHALFDSGASALRIEHRSFNFRYKSAAHWIQIFRDYYGPTHKAFAALNQERQDELEQALTVLLERFNVAGPDFLVIPSEYLEVVITKKAA